MTKNMYLGLSEDVLKERGALHTAREISGQPSLWREISENILKQRDDILSFLDKSLTEVDNIILTGAGTSSYVGLSLKGIMSRNFNKEVHSVPTTDIVTHPLDYFSKNKKLMLISFARSGNSPESIAAVELADKLSLKCIHLIITCDPQGKLAKYDAKYSRFLVTLPPQANDKGLAMTGSYSGMLFSGLLISMIRDLNALKSQLESLFAYGEKIIELYAPELKRIADLNFKRAVFLGSGPFYGTASEAHLKLQELTNGEIVCKEETFLGLRHGPKAVVRDDTLVVYFFSNDPYALKYENDLALAIAKGHRPVAQIAVCENHCPELDFDLLIKVAEGKKDKLSEELLTVCYILAGQMLGFYKSLERGLKPDTPSADNVISRVVEGVKIYEYK